MLDELDKVGMDYRGDSAKEKIRPESKPGVATGLAWTVHSCDEIKRKFQDQEIPLPSAWGGDRVIPDSFEFWQGRPNRLHDRFLYSHPDTESAWKIQRLAP